MFSITKAITIGTLSILLTACGGGGGGGDGTVTTGNPETGGQQTDSPQAATNPNAPPRQVTNQDAPIVAAPPPQTEPPPPTEPAWTLTDLSAVTGPGSEPVALNDNGDVAGQVVDINSPKIPTFIRPFVLASGQDQVTYLGNLGNSYGHTTGINNAGQITGYGYVESADATHAFSYRNGRMVDIGALIGTGASFGSAINGLGDIAVTTDDKVYVYSNGTMTLVPGARMDFISAFNDSGRMVGTADAQTYQTAAYYDGSTTILLNPLQGDTSTLATGMNSAGTAVGVSYNLGDAEYRSFIFENGSMREISVAGEAGISATAINDAGDIVGWAQTPDRVGKAFLYRNGRLTDLNTLPGIAGTGWTLQSALKINNAGQILILGSFNGQRRYALLTPP
jgi:probable HAF family extracellular repeat protein